MPRQDFPDFPGIATYEDVVHKDGYTTDRNGDRWKKTWRPRRGLSRIVASETARIGTLLGFIAKDGTRHILGVQSDGTWVQDAEPAVVWDD